MEHVYGHQDDHKKFDELPPITHANCMAHDRAYGAGSRTDIPKCDELFQVYPASLCTLYIKHEPIVGAPGRAMRDAFSLKQQQIYFSKKYEWSDDLISQLWFEPMTATMKSFNDKDRRRIAKSRCRWLPCASRQHIVTSHISSTCWGCSSIEDHYHIFTCPNYKSIELRKQRLEKFRYTLHKKQLPHAIQEAWSTGLHAWLFKRRKTIAVPVCHPALQAAIIEQNSLGWDHALSGFITKKWKEAMIASHDPTVTPLNTAGWSITLLTSLFRLMIGIWTDRNDMHHGSNDEERPKILNKNLLIEIKYLYGIFQKAETKYHFQLQLTLDEWQETEARAKRDWLATARRLSRSERKERQQQIAKRKQQRNPITGM